MTCSLRISALLAGLALAVACGGAARQQPVATATVAPPVAPTVPADWQRVQVYELTIPIPAGWKKTIDSVGKSDRAEADPPQILYFGDQAADPNASRRLAIWIWPSASVDDLVRRRFVESSLSTISHGTIPSGRPMREVVARATWSDQRGSGSYRARSLFVQVDAPRVIQVSVSGPQLASTETEPSAEMRSIQEIVVHNVTAVPSSGCQWTRITDQWGVITVDGKTGILDRTYASAADVNGGWVMVRRGTAVGERISVRFDQIGTSAPAKWVAYEDLAEPRPTQPGIAATPWDGAAFTLGHKPVAFDNSCWRLIVNGADTGIVLFVGP